MRFSATVRMALLFVAVLCPCPRVFSSDLQCYEDATLRGVQMSPDGKLGWAVGDEGVVWHTRDGGQKWFRQDTGTRASLRSVSFISPLVGWVVGRQEQADGSSVGVILFTNNGGEEWRRVFINRFPGLNRIRFASGKTGFLIGDGCDRFPTGIFRTDDGGRSWKPIPGKRIPTWYDADFLSDASGALVGGWNHLGTLKEDKLQAADREDSLGGRNIRGIRMLEDKAIAVGDGGLILVSRSGGARWGYAQTKVPKTVLANIDFHAVDCLGKNVWAVGRPGSVIFHSGDQGLTWRMFQTGQSLPLYSVYFANPQNGWAVGALGTILHSNDGGQTWKTQRAGGQRSAALVVHADESKVPVETITRLGLMQGYLTTGLRVTGPDPTTASADLANSEQRFAAAIRQSGGAHGESLWQYPLPEHLRTADPNELLKHWNTLHDNQAPQEMLRQLVLALRVWRPDVVVTDQPKVETGQPHTGALVAEGIHQAFKLAGNPKAFPEQIEQLGLQPWTVSKSYVLWQSVQNSHVVVSADEISHRLKDTPGNYATAAAALLSETLVPLPKRRFFRLVDSTSPDMANGSTLMSQIKSSKGATRKLPPIVKLEEKSVKALQDRQQVLTLVGNGDNKLISPDAVLAQLRPMLKHLPRDQGANATFAIGQQYARQGQWVLAQEVFLTLVDRYPTHPLAVDAYRWLIQYNTSSEARRRHELGQFLLTKESHVKMPTMPTPEQMKQFHQQFKKETDPDKKSKKGKPGQTKEKRPADPPLAKPGPLPFKPSSVDTVGMKTFLSDHGNVRHWLKGSIAFGDRLEQFGPMFHQDPAIQFCLQSAQRQLGQFDKALKWHKKAMNSAMPGNWQKASAAESWLAYRAGLPPREVMGCRVAPSRPHLDGKFDDACWQNLKPTILQNAVGDTNKSHRTEVRMSFDDSYLYLALSCQHPPEYHIPPVKVRKRDENLTPYDRVEVMLDLDRDYSTYFRFKVDQRGCVHDACWGDDSWNPKWFVAVRSSKTEWHIEAAIPLVQLTANRVSLGTTWACNVVRVLPNRGVQAFSLPANANPLPENMGLLMFRDDPAQRFVTPTGK